MKATLISPFTSIRAYGLRVLSACLKKEGYNIQLIFLPNDFQSRYDNKILEELRKLCIGSELIGISVMTNYFNNCVQITEYLKNLCVPIIWGGVHPMVRPIDCLNYADIICIGEGEESIVELAKKLEDGYDYYDIPGMWCKVDNKIIKNDTRPLIQNLDFIPFQDYDYKSHYILHKNAIRNMDAVILDKYTQGSYATQATRGCPFGCSYCYNNTLNRLYSTSKIRKRSIDNIMGELIAVKEKIKGLKYIRFGDDAFLMLPLPEIRDFNIKYKKHIGLPLIIGGTTPWTITREKLSLLVDAGLKSPRMGIESGSERIKEMYHRNYSNEQVVIASNIISEFKHRISPPSYDIILDNPWETEDDLIQTLILLTKLSTPYTLSFFSLTFYPGTELYERAKKDGLIGDELTAIYCKHYKELRNTYINKLFSLINLYSRHDRMIPQSYIMILTDKRMRKYQISYLLYILLMMNNPSIRHYIKYILYEGIKSVMKGDTTRIWAYLKFKINKEEYNYL